MLSLDLYNRKCKNESLPYPGASKVAGNTKVYGTVIRRKRVWLSLLARRFHQKHPLNPIQLTPICLPLNRCTSLCFLMLAVLSAHIGTTSVFKYKSLVGCALIATSVFDIVLDIDMSYSYRYELLNWSFIKSLIIWHKSLLWIDRVARV